MDKREAAALTTEDSTTYGVIRRERGHNAVTTVTGYRSAKVVAGKDGVILTESEMKRELGL